MSADDTNWARDVYGHLLAQLEDESQPVTAALLQCDAADVQQLRNAVTVAFDNPDARDSACANLDVISKHAYCQMSRVYKQAAAVCWRRMYTDAAIFRTLADLMYPYPPRSDALLKAAVSRLDRVIIIAGACGEGRLELTQDLIAAIQAEMLHSVAHCKELPPPVAERQIALPSTFSAPVSRLEIPPSFSAFVSQFCHRPFVLPGFIRDWPALNAHPWNSLEYLRKVAGPGRVVPIEVGSDYRSDDWTQKMMGLDEFLDALADFAHGNATGAPILYLAQHSIFMQIPALRDDIITPDYLYASPPAPDNYPSYQPPHNDEQLVMNAWLGPVGTISPAHTDPFYNCYAQVVGRKTVWLAPPECTPYMYAYPAAGGDKKETKKDQPKNPAQNTTSPSMSNTSQVDVFSDSAKEDFPLFAEHVVPEAICVTLEAGDLLFFPPAWWHALRSEETSFSVSMWF